jgi:hypothetical protein
VKGQVRKSVIAGTWYPGSPAVLRSEIEQYFQDLPSPGISGEVVGLVSPHAGYVYSGRIAAHACGLVRGMQFESVIMIGPSHRSLFPGISVYSGGGFETPLGIVPVDAATAERIIDHSGLVHSSAAPHLQEHSLEIQLPLLQVALGNFRFVPILMGSQDRKTCEDLAGAVFRAAEGKNVLIVASSDLSHYHSYERAVRKDGLILKQVERMNADGLLRELEKGEAEACGGGPMAAVLMACKKMGCNASKILAYANSGDVTGDRSGVVGYMAAAFYRRTGGNG